MERGLFPITPKYKVQGDVSTAELAVEFTGGVRSYFEKESPCLRRAVAARPRTC